MNTLLIRGGQALHGEVLISGAKNAALPELCACLLTADPVALRDVPRLHDLVTMQKLIHNVGVQVGRQAQGAELSHDRIPGLTIWIGATTK